MARVAFKKYEEADEKTKQAWDAQVKKSGHVTNMKQALLQSVDTYLAYLGWYDLYAKLNDLLGEKDSVIFAHAISTTNGCILCSLFFISDLKELGEDPNNLKFNEKEELLVELGQQFVKDPNGFTDAFFDKLRKHFSDEDIVLLVGFAGFMVAYNNFNSALDIDLDEKFLPIKGEFKAPTWRNAK